MGITWEKDVKGYFTDYDVQHMLQIQPQLNLRSYDSVKDNAVLIYPRVANKSMPPGGWTDQRIADFKSWIDAGMPEKDLDVRLFTANSGLAPHPSVRLNVPAGFKIIGGGAFDHWSGEGNLLTASYPGGLQTWVAEGKDHQVASQATITAYAVAILDPNDEWDVVIKSQTSSPEPHPRAVAVIPDGYTLTGGGAFASWKGAGSLLTASFPNGDSSWEARSKDHLVSDPSTITSYAIGLKHRKGAVKLQRIVKNATGPRQSHPEAQACLEAGWILSGGGALDSWDGSGNLLTASYPEGLCWRAAGKDHQQASPGTMTAYAIGIRAA